MSVGAVRTPLALLAEWLASYAAAALFVAIFAAGSPDGPSLLAVTAAGFGGVALAQVLQRLDVDEGAMRTIAVGASTAGVFVIAHFEYAPDDWLWELAWVGDLFAHPVRTMGDHPAVSAGVPALAAVWFRNAIRGQQPLEYDAVLASASAGVVVMAVAAAVAPPAGWPGSFGALALIYALLALMALAAWRSVEPEQPLARFARRWAPPGAALAALVAVAAVAAAAVDADSLGFLEPVAGPLGYGLGRVLLIILAPLFFALEGAVRGLGWLLDQLVPDGGGQNEQRPQEPLAPPERDKEPSAWSKVLGYVAGATLIGVLLTIAIALAWFAFRRYGRSDESAGERREDIEPTPDDSGRSLFDWLRRPFTRSRARSGVAVRRLYLEMLDRAADDGLERPPAATPLQFAPELDAHFASRAPDAISRAYAESAYGAREIDDETVARLRAEWDALPPKP